MKLKFLPIYIAIVTMVLFSVPVVVVYAYNTIFFIEDLIVLSHAFNPIVTYAIFFGVIGIFVGMFSAAKKFTLKSTYYINAIIGILFFVSLFFLFNKPHKYQTIGEYKEQQMFEYFSHNPTYSNAKNYLHQFNNGKNSRSVRDFTQEKLLDSAQKLNTAELWKYYLAEFPDTEKRAEITSLIDDLQWRKATRLNFKSAYSEYLSQQPKGKYVEKAKSKIRRLNKRDAAIAQANRLEQEANGNLETDNNELNNQDGNSNETNTTGIENNRTINNTTETKPTVGHLTIEYQDGRKYFGNVINGEPNGKGKEIFPDGTVLSGNYANGKRDGKFIFTTVNGEKQEQVFRAGNRIK